MTKQQQWAKRAHEQVQKYKDNEDFTTAAKRSPGLLVQSGIVQTFSFWQSNEEKEYLESITYVFNGDKQPDAAEKLATKIRNEELLQEYLQISHDLIECSIWLRRFVLASAKEG